MRYGIISDIHSNLEALEKVIQTLRRDSVDQYLCLGDLIGYGADPKVCIELIRSLNAITVVGNHDWAVLHPETREFFNFNREAKEAILWTAKQISSSQKDYLASLPFIKEMEDFTLIHGSLQEPEKFNYILTLEDLVLNFRLLRKKVCFFGHSHTPGIYRYDIKKRKIEVLSSEMVKFAEGKKYFINVGSVGQPRDRNPASCFALYDTEEETLWIKRCLYGLRKTQEKIIHAGLPEIFATRLMFGT